MPVLPRSAVGWIVHRLDTAALIVRGDSPMATPRVLHSAAPLIALALLLLTGAPRPQAQPVAPLAVPIDADDIGGVVTGMPVAYRTQEQWLNAVQLNGCGNCHQLGDKATRAFPEALEVAGRSSIDAWTRRLQSGPGGGSMVRFIGLMNTNDGGHLKRLAEWTDRIRAGERPASVPPRPLIGARNRVRAVSDWRTSEHHT